jgi:hypothetical protein
MKALLALAVIASGLESVQLAHEVVSRSVSTPTAQT